ncbi:bifunctional 3'-5' exonuclease/DNA polymerase [Luteimicrobium subarcticum]|uniref:DNA-directed DNA polymerase n=1 Tax=Luteimicrobium subarcticum TaxID=620910 RepID=A0A2M8WR68_9MICO|nr:bifunctional 3'-5' exonuclease/DNA polymerase [Luteimicrobium subarcticum]PJI93432.1 DNA polymerase-1 [Luteimicrobium subarcticum]
MHVVVAEPAVSPDGADAAAVVGLTGDPAATEPPRWTWADTNLWYPGLLAAGARVARAHDLRLAHRVLRTSAWTTGTALATRGAGPWDALPTLPVTGRDTGPSDQHALFEIGPDGTAGADDRSPDAPACRAALRDQLAAVAASTRPGRLRLLLAAEAAGALAAVEMHHVGVPWDAVVHDAVLTESLGARPPAGTAPPRMAALADDVRTALDAPNLHLDSMPDVLRALRRTGLPVTSTRSWELREVDHPAIDPLLAYKKLSRLHSANGWSWLEQWVHGHRFRPEYVVSGVVTGRWGSSGGGALQLPRRLRTAVRADPGWVLVVADAAQLEPRVLAGLARDERMAAAGHGQDLYQGMVDAHVVDSRAHGKVGMLGAMYGGTTGASAAVLPRLAKAFPASLALVEAAARTGEVGGVVTTHLGRTSPRPGAAWHDTQALAQTEDAGVDDESRARAQTRAWGRFTRNFVVQGTAAEWALCWIAGVRRDLWALGEQPGPASRAPEPFARRPHLAYFLHDELVVHCPAALADDVARLVQDAAAGAGQLLFPGFPVDFPLSVGAATSYADAKDA